MTTSKLIRIWYAFSGAVLWIAIYLTGFSNVHWLMYIPAAGFIFAAITGFCPSHMAISKMLGGK